MGLVGLHMQPEAGTSLRVQAWGSVYSCGAPCAAVGLLGLQV